MEKKKMSLTNKMLIALILGIGTGFLLQVTPELTVFGFSIRDDLILGGILRLVGQLFLNGLFMIVTPLILISLVVGITSIPDPKKVGRIGGKLTAFYLLSTFPAIGAAMFFGWLINPAASVGAYVEGTPNIGEPLGVVQILINIIPRQPFGALATGQTLSVIFIAVALGLAILAVGKPAEPVKRLFVASNEVIMKITSIIMKFAPYGVFALIAHTFEGLSLSAIGALFMFVLTVWIALAFHAIFIYGGALKLLVGKDPHTGRSVSLRILFKKIAPALAFAFSSASSAATLPVTMKCGRNLGFKREMVAVTFPAGVTLNMDGTAIFQGVAVIFLAGFTGFALDAGMILTVLITATLATLGAAGVPGAGMIMLSVVLTSIGMDPAHIAIIFGIDRIVDMPRTAINVCGDFIYGMIVAKQEDMIDWEQFNNPTDISQIPEIDLAELSVDETV